MFLEKLHCGKTHLEKTRSAIAKIIYNTSKISVIQPQLLQKIEELLLTWVLLTDCIMIGDKVFACLDDQACNDEDLEEVDMTEEAGDGEVGSGLVVDERLFVMT